MNDFIFGRFQRIDSEGGIFCNRVAVDHLDLSIFKDMWKDDPPYKEKDFPMASLKKLDMPLNIKNVDIRKSNITYEQKGDVVQVDKTGIIEFINGSFQINNITNMAESIKKDSFLTFNGETYIYGTGKTFLELKADLSRNDGYFEVIGHMDTLPAFNLNKVLYGILLCEVPAGVIHYIDFHIQANNEKKKL